MVGSRTLTAVAGLVGSLVVTGLLWWYFDTLAVFLFLPFVPFLFRGRREQRPPEPRTCPTCGYQTQNETHDYCPRDGTKLQ